MSVVHKHSCVITHTQKHTGFLLRAAPLIRSSHEIVQMDAEIGAKQK